MSNFSGGRSIRRTSWLGAEAWSNRGIALALFLPQLAVLGVALKLTPNADGMGTHQQLGLQPCGFLVETGYPCATCGMTTSFTWAAHGHLVKAFLTQPAGSVLCVMSMMAALVSLYAMITGISLVPLWKAVWRPGFVGAMILMILAAWAYTITIHNLLPGHPGTPGFLGFPGTPGHL